MRTLLPIFFTLLSLSGIGQDGLEGIIVEKYYVSSEADNAAKNRSGELEEGSVTYRIFVDLKPGYRFQAAYGSPGHPLKIKSTKPFFNHNTSGTSNAAILPEKSLSADIALLDSWLSAGAGGENHLAIPLAYDKVEKDVLIQFKKGFLENKPKKKSLTLSEKDGLSRSSYIPFPTFFQIDSCLKFLGTATSGDSLVIHNGAWACMGKGSVGADSLTTNTVCIAQLTTAGKLSFELNLMIGGPDGKSYKYVARNPATGELTHKSLILENKSKARRKRKKS